MRRDWLVEIRKEKGITQEDIASQVGLTRQMISAIERGIGTKPATAQKIASALGFDWTRFYRRDIYACHAKSDKQRQANR